MLLSSGSSAPVPAPPAPADAGFPWGWLAVAVVVLIAVLAFASYLRREPSGDRSRSQAMAAYGSGTVFVDEATTCLTSLDRTGPAVWTELSHTAADLAGGFRAAELDTRPARLRTRIEVVIAALRACSDGLGKLAGASADPAQLAADATRVREQVREVDKALEQLGAEL